MNYFKAEIYVMTELYVNNDYNEGGDPDTGADCGLVETIKKPTLEALMKDLKNNYDNIEHFEENRFETGYDNVERDGTKVCNMVSIYISEVTEAELNTNQVVACIKLLK